ncbi:7103_t:CDS:2 [Entrophospora sp. SA101]|nr:7103_t:CDS:2 [Entrophospora sp. SA101]
MRGEFSAAHNLKAICGVNVSETSDVILHFNVAGNLRLTTYINITCLLGIQ